MTRFLLLGCLMLFGGCSILFEGSPPESIVDGGGNDATETADSGTASGDAANDCEGLANARRVDGEVMLWNESCGALSGLEIANISDVAANGWALFGNDIPVAAGLSLEFSHGGIRKNLPEIGNGAIEIELGMVPDSALQIIGLVGSANTAAQFHRGPGHRNLFLFDNGGGTISGSNATCNFDTQGSSGALSSAVRTMHLKVQTILDAENFFVQFSLEDRSNSTTVIFETFRFGADEAPFQLSIRGSGSSTMPMYLYGVKCPL